ncbi:hypothetical protein LVJ83_09165 [Uruburuella testudinis]|uniref:Uncharacterized protein n=1 Tax=Uruburuella testudinis TaxID=1282863 RepID=A0ABY4DQ36_9NEIS|nr:hypothetical protein [Uruburuella testudinis]UOO81145.1 hypothetical protein LVJ83_09165 [Uruburuella testudinis]
MSAQAFILSDCEYPECEEKPYALLVANPTKGHHFISQTEQRQHAFNTHVNAQNRNVYRWPLPLFEKNRRGQPQSVNIENNLEYPNLYTLTFVKGNGGRQYNLESWFSRYESGYEEACNRVLTLPSGRLQVPEPLWRILKLKLLGILRNPFNRSDPFVYRLHHVLFTQLPQVSEEFIGLIAERPQQRLDKILHTFGFNIDEYTRWLANLYGMLSEGVHRPSLFERLFAALFNDPAAVKIELYRYNDRRNCCFFADSGYCLQASQQRFSIGMNLSAEMFAIVHVERHHWDDMKQRFPHAPTALQAEVRISDDNHTQRRTYNRLTIRQACEAVYGRSNRRQDYF